MTQMPVAFIGHGSPMNIVEKNDFTATWKVMADKIPRPKAILCISAHWYGEGQYVCSAAHPKTIHDFYGFPEELFKIRYQAPGAPELAARIAKFEHLKVTAVDDWGLDHGAWSVLGAMYPNADVPVCQLSVNARNTPMESYRVGQALRDLRSEGVLIVGSGNVVHNLGLVNWDMEREGYPWATEFDVYIRDAIISGNHNDVIHYERAGETSRRAFSRRDHFDPLLYVLGAVDSKEPVQVFNDERVLGALSMTSYIIGK